MREKKFFGAKGKLIGRPDVARPDEVLDFKTGDVFEDVEPEQLKAGYIRQLRLYAFLVKETLGWWPRRGVLLPMVGAPVAVELEPEECEAEAAEAVRLLDEYNDMLRRSADPIELASPSPASSRWCQYQLYCPAFWSSVGPDWKDGFARQPLRRAQLVLRNQSMVDRRCLSPYKSKREYIHQERSFRCFHSIHRYMKTRLWSRRATRSV